MVAFFLLFFYVKLMLLAPVNTTGEWCSAAGKKNKFLSCSESGRSDFSLVIIAGILAVICLNTEP